MSNNYVDGVNITYGGGNRNVSWSKIENNVGYGMAVWLNETTGILYTYKSTTDFILVNNAEAVLLLYTS